MIAKPIDTNSHAIMVRSSAMELGLEAIVISIGDLETMQNMHVQTAVSNVQVAQVEHMYCDHSYAIIIIGYIEVP